MSGVVIPDNLNEAITAAPASSGRGGPGDDVGSSSGDGSSNNGTPRDSSGGASAGSSSDDSSDTSTSTTSRTDGTTRTETGTATTRTTSDDASSESTTSTSIPPTRSSTTSLPERTSSTTVSSISTTTSAPSDSTKTTETSSSTSSEDTRAKDETSTKEDRPSSSDQSSALTKTSADHSSSKTLDPSPSQKDNGIGVGGLSVGSIIGISLAGLTVIGILLVVLGTFLKYRRKKALDRSTAHLKRVSEIWDLADTKDGGGFGNPEIEKANKAAASIGVGPRDVFGGGGGGAPPRPSHSRSGSDSESTRSGLNGGGSISGNSQAGAQGITEHALHSQHLGGMAATHPHQYNQQQHQMHPNGMNSTPYGPGMVSIASHPMGTGGGVAGPFNRLANRLSSIPFFHGNHRPAPAPPVPHHHPNALQAAGQDTFGNRVAGPLRNNFFPPPPPSIHDGYPPVHAAALPPTQPLALPGQRQ